MARAIHTLAAAALLVGSIGCIYATGVQDYKVDDNANSTGGGDDSACFNAPNGSACRDCCVGHHTDDANKFISQLQACACKPDTCQSACDSDLCASGNFAPGGACDGCVSSLSASQCPDAASNTYFICARGCAP